MGAHDLVHEAVRLDAQPDDGDPQDGAAGDHHLVLPERVVDGVEGDGVVAPVDLDGETDVLPPDVEVDPARGRGAHDLTVRRRETVASTEPAEVELPQGVGTVAHVADDVVDEPSAGAAPHLPPRVEQPLGGDQSLLDDEADDEGCLSIGPGPLGGPDRRVLDAGAGHADVDRGAELTPGTAPHAVHGMASVVGRDGHVDGVGSEAAQAMGDQGRCAVEYGACPGLPHGPPHERLTRDGLRADDHRVAPGLLPPTGSDLESHCTSVDPGRTKVAPVGDPGEPGRDLCGQGGSPVPCIADHVASVPERQGCSLRRCGQLTSVVPTGCDGTRLAPRTGYRLTVDASTIAT